MFRYSRNVEKAGAFYALALEQELLEVRRKMLSCREEGKKMFTHVLAHLEAFHTCFLVFFIPPSLKSTTNMSVVFEAL